MSINLGLDRIRDLLANLPAYTRPTCHIAGTNGKGSVSAMLSSVLHASAYRVGRFNSPHLVEPTDSIAIDDVPVSQAVYARIREQVESANAVGASSFEVLTATALLVFEHAQVDIAVVEVGMGGRLDATNAIPDACVLVSGLTAVDLDHQAFLGTTVAEIAFEKASIARPGRPFVLGPQIHPEVEGVARKVVAAAGGHFAMAVVPSRRERDVSLDGEQHLTSRLTAATFRSPAQPVLCLIPPFSDPLKLTLPLPGDHQLENLGTVLGLISALLTNVDAGLFPQLNLSRHITPESITRGIRSTSWPGRLSFHTIHLPDHSDPAAPPLLVLADGAHNPASASTLGKFIAQLVTRSSSVSSSQPITLTFVLSLSRSPPKTPLQTLAPLFAPLHALPATRFRVALLRFSPPEGMPWVSAEAPSYIKDAVASLLPKAEIWTAADEGGAETQEEMARALRWAAAGQRDGEEGLTVVAGSLYLVADFYRLLRARDALKAES